MWTTSSSATSLGLLTKHGICLLEETDAAHSQTTPHSVLLPHGQYGAFSLATALAATLNATTSVAGAYSCSFSELTQTLSVSATQPFRLFTDKEAGTAWQAQDVARSANLVIGNTAVSAVNTLWHANRPPDLHIVKQLFLHSSSLGSYTAMNSYGADMIVRRITVAAPFGSFFESQHSLQYDYLDVGHAQLSELDFRLTDSNGHAVSLQGTPLCFSILLVEA